MNKVYTIPGKAIFTLRRNLNTGINSRLSIYLNIYYLYIIHKTAVYTHEHLRVCTSIPLSTQFISIGV